MDTAASSNRVCIGRFAFSLPRQFSLAGRSQSIYRVDVRALPVGAQGPDALWKAHLLEIRAEAPPPEVADRVIRTYDLDAATRAVMFYDSGDVTVARRLDAMRVFGDHAVFVSRAGAEGQDGNMEKLDRHILDSYVPAAEYGFCIERGAIAAEPANNESSLARFNLTGLPNSELVFSTQTVSEARPVEDLSDVNEIRSAMSGSDVRVIRSARRAAAGLEGLEERVTISPPSEPAIVRFSWKYPGEAFRSDRPLVTIRAISPTEHQTAMEEAWETVLSSLHPVRITK